MVCEKTGFSGTLFLFLVGGVKTSLLGFWQTWAWGWRSMEAVRSARWVGMRACVRALSPSRYLSLSIHQGSRPHQAYSLHKPLRFLPASTVFVEMPPQQSRPRESPEHKRTPNGRFPGGWAKYIQNPPSPPPRHRSVIPKPTEQRDFRSRFAFTHTTPRPRLT